jgi:pilus assembly protein CpaE
MSRAFIVGAHYSLANAVAELLSTGSHAIVARRVDYYPSLLEFGRMLREAEPDVLLISLTDFQQAVELHRHAGRVVPGIQTVGLLSEDRGTVPVDAIREGIHEFIECPPAQQQVEVVFQRVSAQLRQRPPQQCETDKVYAFLPARPGLGASTIAVNVSSAIAEMPDYSVLLADLDLHNGVVRLLLNLQEGWSLAEAAMRTGVLDEAVWGQFVHRLGRLDVARAGKPVPDVRLEPVQVASLLRFARRRYRVICADLPGTLDPASMVVLREASNIFLVTTPEPLSLYMAREDMQMLDQLGLGHRVQVVLNRYSPKSAPAPAEAARTIGAPVVAVIPNDYRATQQAVRQGQPVAAASLSGTAIHGFAHWLAAGRPQEQEPEPRLSLASLFGLRKTQVS